MMAKNGKNASSEAKPITTSERRLLGIVVALVPTLFIALGAFIWTINADVIKLEARITNVESGTTDRYTKADARDDHERVDKWHDAIGQRINELSAEVNQLKGRHESHKP